MLDEIGNQIQGIIGVMIPIVGTVAGVSLAFGAIYLRYRERMEMISRGMDLSKSELPRRRRSPLRSGMVVLGAGVGLLLAYVLCSTEIADKNPGEDHVVIYFGFVATFVGLGLILSHLMEKRGPADEIKA